LSFNILASHGIVAARQHNAANAKVTAP